MLKEKNYQYNKFMKKKVAVIISTYLTLETNASFSLLNSFSNTVLLDNFNFVLSSSSRSTYREGGEREEDGGREGGREKEVEYSRLC